MSGSLRRLLTLLAVLAVVTLLQSARGTAGTSITMAAGALLLCGVFAGQVARAVGLPRLTGYLLIGIAIGPHLLRFIPGEGVVGLELVKGLAVSLIALTAGAELELGMIRRVGARVALCCLAVVGLVFAVCTLVVIGLKPLLPALAGMDGVQVAAVAALLSSVVVSFSPTVTIAIVQETRARGSFTEFLMAMVILGDLLVLVIFALAVGLTRGAFEGGLGWGGLAGGVGWELFGSLLFGALLGAGVLAYVRLVRREVPLFLSVACFVSAEAGTALHLSPLLLSLAAGALVANVDGQEAHRMKGAVERAGLPVFALFFAAAGAGLHLEALGQVGPVALVLVAARGLAIFYGCRWFAPADDGRLRKNLWMGLISQAGVTFGLAALLGRTFPGFGPALETLVIAMVTLHELVGPVLTRRALALAGEVDADGGAEKV